TVKGLYLPEAYLRKSSLKRLKQTPFEPSKPAIPGSNPGGRTKNFVDFFAILGICLLFVVGGGRLFKKIGRYHFIWAA
ncbi:MAG: hypothetical protein QW546_03920, partial [Candidatus Bathyarchaeia archaeon]